MENADHDRYCDRGRARAPTANAGTGWTSYGQITEFTQVPPITPGNEMVFLKLSAASNPSGCSAAQGFYFPVNTEYQKRMFAMLLAARAGGQAVQLYVTGTCHLWGYAETTGVVIE